MKAILVKAFTKEKDQGNPAGVIFDADKLLDGKMLEISDMSFEIVIYDRNQFSTSAPFLAWSLWGTMAPIMAFWILEVKFINYCFKKLLIQKPNWATISQKPIIRATIAPPEILFTEICQRANAVAAIKLAKPQRILTIGFDF
jgi:hypothetical protein